KEKRLGGHTPYLFSYSPISLSLEQALEFDPDVQLHIQRNCNQDQPNKPFQPELMNV
ncbi:MAG: hypothetical protein QOH93_1607, partial [Chloroflexia bacterium]|nr:hypothetical protein [Chloroflexia bacterium]